MEQTDVTIHGSNIMVIGYGRIGKVLSEMLSGIGANVFTVVNSNEAAAYSKSFGHSPVCFNDMTEKLNEMDIIFNTVPSVLIDKTNMKYLDQKCVIVDLASPPYGVDYQASKEFGIKVLYANSLPGNVAPKTVAGYIRDTIYNALIELRGNRGVDCDET